MTVDVVTVGSIIGGLIGIVTFLLKILIASKNDEIKRLEYELRDVTGERDLFRSMAMMQKSREQD